MEDVLRQFGQEIAVEVMPEPTDPIIGHVITSARMFSNKDYARNDWERSPYDAAVALVLDNGVVVYGASDAGENGPGVLVAHDPSTDNPIFVPDSVVAYYGLRRRRKRAGGAGRL